MRLGGIFNILVSVYYSIARRFHSTRGHENRIFGTFVFIGEVVPSTVPQNRGSHTRYRLLCVQYLMLGRLRNTSVQNVEHQLVVSSAFSLLRNPSNFTIISLVCLQNLPGKSVGGLCTRLSGRFFALSNVIMSEKSIQNRIGE